jgi:N-acetylmuramoyl-L-alanine amidase
VLYIPDRTEKPQSCATGRRHRFVTKAHRRVLRIALSDTEGRRMANTPYELVVEGRTYAGTTDGEGLLDQRVPIDAQSGTGRSCAIAGRG